MKNFKKEVKRKVIKRVKYLFPYVNDGVEYFVDPEDILDYDFSHQGVRLSHVAHYKKIGNCGDVLLPRMVRDVFTHFEKEQYLWNGYHVSQPVCSTIAKKMSKSQGKVIGGGGLFLRDTSRNSLSGWQWAVSASRIDAMKMPLVLFGVGYNRFRNQKDFNRKFRKNLRILANRSLYLGMRNHGSIEALKTYLPEEFHSKLRYQPCPTTLSASLYPDMFGKDDKEAEESKIIAFNYAHDRIGMRLGKKKEAVLDALVQEFKGLIAQGYELHFYAHHSKDQKFLHYLDKAGVSYELVKLYRMNPTEILECYAKPVLALGMRGHAQMIPFGCATPVISLISHDKLAWFLDDIKHPEWGIEMLDEDFAGKLKEKVTYFLENREQIKDEIMISQEELMEVTRINVYEFMAEVRANNTRVNSK